VIIGLHGKMGAGKNEAAKRLARLSSLPVVEVSYAAKLKESAAALLGCTVADLERWKNDPMMTVVLCNLENEDPLDVRTVRSFLQRYGTEAHRDVFGEDFWLDAALPAERNGIRGRVAYDESLYVVTDVRFPNEAQRIRDLGGIVVGIIGPSDDTGSHASEVPLDCDLWINNTRRDDGYATLDVQLAERVLAPLGLTRKRAA
jgi:hypothetical protein